MKEKKIRKGFRSLLAGILAFVLALTPALSSLPAIEAQAASDPVVWQYVKAGDGNGNTHSYSNASATPAAVLLNQSATMPVDGQLKTKVRFTNENPAEDARFAVFYTYQDDEHWIYVGYDNSSKWYYQYKNGSTVNYPKLDGLPEPENGKEYEITISLTHETLQVDVVEGTNEYNSTKTNQALYTLAEAIDGNGRFGFRAAKHSSTFTEFMFRDFTYTGQDENTEDTWQFLLPDLGSLCETRTIQTYSVSGNVTNEEGAAVAGANVRLGNASTVTDEQGNYTIDEIEAGTYTISVSAAGYEAVTKDITVVDADVTADTIVLSEKAAVIYDTYIASSEMKAAIDPAFPRVMQYEMLSGAAEGKIFKGQEDEIDTIQINNHSITPELTDFQKSDDSAVYKMKLVDAANSIDLDMEVTVSVKENDLTWEVTDITKNNGCAKINTINVPKLNLVTINDSQENTQFKGAVNSGDVSANATGDREINFGSGGGFVSNNSSGYVYGFVSADGLSAGLWSNSEALKDQRVIRNNGSNTISLTSAAWYYEYGNDASAAQYDYIPVSELPCTKVCIAPDLNEDGVADWQDGAIAYRDIMNNPYGSENVPEMVNYRIVMNLGSLAPNPFMKSADNVKKVYLATDGLPQAIMLKGFGNEGHDSANSEYGGIAERLGGAEDLKKLNTIAHQYNTEVGIHVNANEAYPEAQTFSEDLILPSQIMNPTTWGWMDKSYEINKIYDLGSGLRYKRFLQLYDQLNDTSLYANKWPGVAGQGEDETVADEETINNVVAANISNPENLDFIYLDVWYQDSWETRKIAQQINSLGWRFSTEFGTSGEYDSTWQHWATEGHYGGVTGKGNNSEVMRFIRNHQKDSYVLNYPVWNKGYSNETWGVASNNPLLGGFTLSGFEGWGSSNDSYNDYIVATFTENLPTKFLQHYQVYKWENYEDGEAPTGYGGKELNHEKQITLKNDDGDTVVVTRNEEQRADEYIERTITLNGTKVLDDVAYLLPWEDWETNEEKLYHWNYDGGTTTWELLDGWKDLQNVVVYELSDQGRDEGRTVDVVNGEITLEAKARTAYVVVKGEEAPKTLKADFGESAYVTDPGFNGYAGLGDGDSLNSEVWFGDIDDESIKVKKVSTGNQYLMIDSPSKDVAVSTKLHSLVPGQNYVAEIYVENWSDVKASIEVSDAKETVSNYSLKSLEQNWNQADAHSRRAVSGSKMQVMQVSFVAASDTATLTLKREAGEGMTHFDDIRIVAKAVYNFREDGTFVQNFESVVQGYYPFVLGPAQGVTDPVTHLSELHAPYSQSGWGSKVLDDVISGKWSLKHHGANTGIIYRTIPQNYHFEAGKTYEVSFDYQSGSANSYNIVIGDETGTTETLPYMEKTAVGVGQASFTKTFSFTITGAESGQSWFGLYSNGRQESGEMGQRDFIMDNLVIRETTKAVTALNLNKETITFKGANGTETITATVTGDDSAEISYASSNDAIATVDANGVVTPVAYGETTITVTAKTGGTLLAASVNVTVARNGQESCEYTRVYANTEETSSESGGKGNTIDGNSSTLWHTNYSSSPFTVSESNPAILTYQLNNGESFNTLRFQQRATGGTNGLIKKYQFVWGTSFDESTHTVSGGESSAVITVDSAKVANSAWIDVDISGVDMNTVKYLQIRVLEGQGGFGAMAEFAAYKYEEYSGSEPASDAVDKESLAAAMKNLVNMNTFGLSEEDIQNLNTALFQAEAVLSSSEATSAQIAEQVANLNRVKEALTSGKKAELQKLISEYEGIDTSAYTSHSVESFVNALKQAKQTVANADASAFDVNDALYILKKSYSDLARKDGGKGEDTTEEKQALNQALTDAAKYDSKLYTAESYAKLQQAVNDAKAILASENATKEQLKNALDALKNAINGLVEDTTEEKQALNQALTDAAKYDSKLYTAESYAKLQQAVNDAKAILASENATKEQLKNALDALKNAINGLQTLEPMPEPTPNPGIKVGDTVVYKNVQYKVLDASKKTAVAVKGTKKKAKKATVYASVKINGVSCTVVQIGAKAFKGYKKLSQVTIGKNVTTIGKQSFYNCKKLKKVVVKGTKLKNIKKGAFKKTNAKMTVKVPKKLKKKQRTALLKKMKKMGMSKKATLK